MYICCFSLINSFIYKFIRYIWNNTTYVPGTVFSARDTTVNKTDVKKAVEKGKCMLVKEKQVNSMRGSI